MKSIRMMLVIFLFVSTMFLVACSSESGTSGESKNNSSTSSGTSSEGFPDGNSSDEVFELMMGTPHPTTHHAHKNVYLPWADLVEEKTDGRVKIEVYPSSALGSTTTAWEDISSGVYDVGLLTIPYLFDSPFFPYTIASLPFAFPDVEVAYNATQEFFNMHYQEEAFVDLVSLGGLTNTDPYLIFSTKPIKSLEDVKGMKIHVPGDTVANIVEAWEATPVSMAVAEVYQSLERGVVDASIYTPVGALGYSFHEIAPYIVDIGVASTPMAMVMNRDKYESLPADIREIFENELNDFMPLAFRDSYKAEVDHAMEKFATEIEDEGEIIELDSAEAQEFMIPAESVWNAWAEDADTKGYDGKQMIDDFIQILNDNGVNVPF